MWRYYPEKIQEIIDFTTKHFTQNNSSENIRLESLESLFRLLIENNLFHPSLPFDFRFISYNLSKKNWYITPFYIRLSNNENDTVIKTINYYLLLFSTIPYYFPSLFHFNFQNFFFKNKLIFTRSKNNHNLDEKVDFSFSYNGSIKSTLIRLCEDKIGNIKNQIKKDISYKIIDNLDPENDYKIINVGENKYYLKIENLERIISKNKPSDILQSIIPNILISVDIEELADYLAEIYRKNLEIQGIDKFQGLEDIKTEYKNFMKNYISFIYLSFSIKDIVIEEQGNEGNKLQYMIIQVPLGILERYKNSYNSSSTFGIIHSFDDDFEDGVDKLPILDRINYHQSIIDIMLFIISSRATFYEYYRFNINRIKKFSLQSAISAIMSRNMSHIHGSHIEPGLQTKLYTLREVLLDV